MIPKYPSYTARLHEGHKGLVVGIANEQSIAWGCAAVWMLVSMLSPAKSWLGSTPPSSRPMLMLRAQR